jgi:hypothetical protein
MEKKGIKKKEGEELIDELFISPRLGLFLLVEKQFRQKNHNLGHTYCILYRVITEMCGTAQNVSTGYMLKKSGYRVWLLV